MSYWTRLRYLRARYIDFQYNIVDKGGYFMCLFSGSYRHMGNQKLPCKLVCFVRVGTSYKSIVF